MLPYRFCLLFVASTNVTFAQAPSTSGRSFDDSVLPASQCVEVEYGQRRPILDGTGWLLGAPEKLLYWDRRVNNHCISEETVDRIAEYLVSRDLADVKVRVNQYAPADEWRRMVANRRIGAGWKYTLGTLTCLRYTLLPGRLFGGDEYNPYSNTVSLYSDVPALGYAESAYAFDVHQRQHPGTYVAVQSLPFVAMWHETIATGDVLTYVALRGDEEEIAENRRVLYVRYGITLGGEAGRLLPDGSLAFQVVGAGMGHLRSAH